MDSHDAGAEPPAKRNDHDDTGRPAAASGEPSEFDAAVVIMAAERELMNARIAALQAGVDQAYRQLIDARADLMIASGHSDADVVAAAKDYVDEVEAMFERVSTVNVAEMTATIQQGLSNLEAAIALIPPAVEAPPVERDPAGRDGEADAAGV
jgi:hypothetical protein